MSEKESFETATQKQQQAAGMFVAPQPTPVPAKSSDYGPQANQYYQKAKLILPTAVWILIIVGGLCFLSVLSSLNKTINTLDNLIEVERAEMKESEKHEAILEAKRAKAEPLHSLPPVQVFDALPDTSSSSSWLDLPPWTSLEPRSPPLGLDSILDGFMRPSKYRKEPQTSGGFIITSSSGPLKGGPQSMIGDIIESFASDASIPEPIKPIDRVSEPSQPMVTANIDTININLGHSRSDRSKSNKRKPVPVFDELPSFIKNSPFEDIFSSSDPIIRVAPLMDQLAFEEPTVIRKGNSKSFDSPIKSDPFAFSSSFASDPVVISRKSPPPSMPEMIFTIDSGIGSPISSSFDKNSYNLLGMPSSELSSKKKASPYETLVDFLPSDSTSKSTSTKPSDDNKATSKSLLDMLFGPPLESTSGPSVSKSPFSFEPSSKSTESSDSSPKTVTEILLDGSNESKSDSGKSTGQSSQATSPKEERLTDDFLTKSVFMEPIETMTAEAQSKGNQDAVKVPAAKGGAATTAAPAAAGAKPAASATPTPAGSGGAKGATTPAAKPGPTTAASAGTAKGPATTPAAGSTTPEPRKGRSVTESSAGAFDESNKPVINPYGRPGSLLFAFNNSTNNFVPRLLSRLNLARFPCSLCHNASRSLKHTLNPQQSDFPHPEHSPKNNHPPEPPSEDPSTTSPPEIQPESEQNLLSTQSSDQSLASDSLTTSSESKELEEEPIPVSPTAPSEPA